MMRSVDLKGIEIKGSLNESFSSILTPEALFFVASLEREFRSRRDAVLKKRVEIKKRIDRNILPDFLSETKDIREGKWTIRGIPDDLRDRRVEITGPVDRKMVINAMNSGASTFMADFEDAHSPTWDGTISGQMNLRDAVRGTITYDSPDGKHYSLNENPAVLIVRPRGWHLTEKHLLVDGHPVSASLFDYGLFLFHNADFLMQKGSAPYFYLPKLENHKEAALWNEVFVSSQERLGLPLGTIKVTVLIETILAAFETEEILYVLRDHIVGLNCGRWDYIFSFIKKFSKLPAYLFPDRSEITMTRHFLRSYSLLVIRSCHRRGAMAIGGMAAQIPIKNDPEANERALQKVREDKIREASDGHDGTWVAHPFLVPIAKEEFDKVLSSSNQIHKLREDVKVSREDLLKVPSGNITSEGLRMNISVAVQYMAHWLNGNGCVPLYHLMEDAATAEISRVQVWQWCHHPNGLLNGKEKVTVDMVDEMIGKELLRIKKEVGSAEFGRVPYERASVLFKEIIANEDLEPFLTLKVYSELL